MLKRIVTVVFAAVLAVMVNAQAPTEVKYDNLPLQYSGSMMPYDFSLCDNEKAWGDTLQPVFLSYTARHGARFMTSPKKIEQINNKLLEAERLGKLSAEGKTFLAYVRKISAASDGQWGLLSSVGIKEEQRLGSDMAAMLPELFKKGAAKSESTYVPRVIMTMYQFTHALEIPNQHLELTTGSGHRYDSLLRCFSKDKAYKKFREKGKWQNYYDAFVQRNVSAEPARRLFADDFDINRKELRHLTMSMYGLIQSLDASGLDEATVQFMTPQEYEACWKASNMQHYLRNNINPLSKVAGTATSPLLETIISDADEALKGNGEKFHGYFGHAETLLPLFSLMKLPGCFVMTDDFETLSDVWRVQDITPLAANLAIVLLKGQTGEIYASVRLNGRNIAPLQGEGKIVKWDSLKKFWQSRIAQYK